MKILSISDVIRVNDAGMLRWLDFRDRLIVYGIFRRRSSRLPVIHFSSASLSLTDLSAMRQDQRY